MIKIKRFGRLRRSGKRGREEMRREGNGMTYKVGVDRLNSSSLAFGILLLSLIGG